MLGVVVMGMEYYVVMLKEFELEVEILVKVNEIVVKIGVKIVVINDVKVGVKGMDVIYVDVWVFMGEFDDMWVKWIELFKLY